ncbi:hypothetical protein KAH55_14835, partial [bacterium]|nr:hypothetical protein [bacterium]
LGSIDELLRSISSGDTVTQEPMLFNPLPLPRETWLKVPQDLFSAAGVDPANYQKCVDSANSDYLVGPVNIPALRISSKKQLLEKKLLPPHSPVECGHYFVENEWVRITVECNGSLTLLDKRSGEKYPRLNIFADSADTGTVQEFGAQRKKSEYLSKSVPVRRSLIASGPLEGRIRIRYRMKIPAYSLPAGAEGAVMSIWSTIILRADSPAVLFVTKIINTAVQHRLQVRFESGTTANMTEVGDWPDFSQVNIPPVKPGTRRCDLPAASASLVNWLTVRDTDKLRGLTLLTQGIHGWQLVPDTYRTLALTLFRSIGKKGAPAEVSSDVSCLGPMTFNYALLPLTVDESENIAAQNQLYYDQFAPVIDFNGGWKISGIQPPVEISVPEPLLVDLWKMAEDGNGIIMRVVNWQDDHVTAMMALNSEVKHIFVTDTYEINKRELQPTEKGEFELTVPKRSLRTLRIVSK